MDLLLRKVMNRVHFLSNDPKTDGQPPYKQWNGQAIMRIN